MSPDIFPRQARKQSSLMMMAIVMMVNGDCSKTYFYLNLPSLEESTITRSHLSHLRTGFIFGNVCTPRVDQGRWLGGYYPLGRENKLFDITWCVLLWRRPLMCFTSRPRQMWDGERDFGRDGSQSQQPSDFLLFCKHLGKYLSNFDVQMGSRDRAIWRNAYNMKLQKWETHIAARTSSFMSGIFLSCIVALLQVYQNCPY